MLEQNRILNNYSITEKEGAIEIVLDLLGTHKWNLSAVKQKNRRIEKNRWQRNHNFNIEWTKNFFTPSSWTGNGKTFWRCFYF